MARCLLQRQLNLFSALCLSKSELRTCYVKAYPMDTKYGVLVLKKLADKPSSQITITQGQISISSYKLLSSGIEKGRRFI